jgi:dihydrofolate synthase / folylpolyglutamate synthase
VTPEEAEAQLLSLELFGMRFGLDRMRRMMTELGHPERSFRSIHVVGTNGKSSTARMIAAILAAHGLVVGTYLSPHLVGFNERVRVADRDITPQQLADAIGRALEAAERVNRAGAGEDDQVTQFELLTAAAYAELAAEGVEVAVIEAGLGGRHDATNVIPSSVQVLTSVGLEHTHWLGPTVAAIAREKLDVVQPGSALVLGAGIDPDALAVAREVAAARGATIVQADSEPGAQLAVLGLFQRRNFALARAAAQAFLLGLGRELDAGAVRAAAAEVRVPGRMQIVDSRPLTLLDGAHNPDGTVALAESLPEITAGARTGQGRVVAVLSILDDKDGTAMLRALTPLLDDLVLTSSQNPRVLAPEKLGSLLDQLAPEVSITSEIVREPHAALRRARELAGPDGVVLATGSLYLIADLIRDEAVVATRRVSML